MTKTVSLHKWIKENGFLLTGGGLWALGGEPGIPAATGFEQAKLKVLVARLSTYADVALSRSHALVASLFRAADPGIVTDMAYLPPRRDATLLEEAGFPLLFGTATGMSASRFDVVAFSCSHAAEFLNIPWLLEKSGIPLSIQERRSKAPLIVLGGAASSHTSPLNGGGGLIDAAVMGDGEKSIPALAEILVSGKDWSREKLMAELGAGVPGFYDPRSSGTVQRARAIPYPPGDPHDSYFIPYEQEAHGTATVNLSSGCPCFCTFCREGWENRPYRERPAEAVTESMRRAKAALGAEALNPSAFNFDMHSRLFPLLEEAGRLFHRVMPKSERFDLLAASPETAQAAIMLGKRVFTLGLEGISPRLRSFLGKDIETEDILRAAGHLVRLRASELKIFTIATGLERGPDFAAFEELLHDMRPGRMKVVVSLTPLIVQPHTPLQHLGRGVPPGRFEKVRSHLRAICKRAGAEFRTAADVHEINVLQLLSTGDRRLTEALIEISGRELYYSKISKSTERALFDALSTKGIDSQSMLEPKEEAFPWSDVSTGVDPLFLKKRFDAASAMKSGGYCLGKGTCFNCKACPDAESVASLTGHRQAPPPSIDRWEELKALKTRPTCWTVTVEAEDHLRFADSGFFSRAAARCIMLEAPDLVDAYLKPGQVDRGPYRHTAGRIEVELYFFRGSDPALLGDGAFLERASKHVPGMKLIGARPGPLEERSSCRYLITFPAHLGEQAVQKAVALPKAAKVPLPLKITRTAEGLLLLPEGKKARKCSIVEAKIVADFRLEMKVKPSFDPGRIIRQALPEDELRAVVRRL